MQLAGTRWRVGSIFLLLQQVRPPTPHEFVEARLLAIERILIKKVSFEHSYTQRAQPLMPSDILPDERSREDVGGNRSTPKKVRQRERPKRTFVEVVKGVVDGGSSGIFGKVSNEHVTGTGAQPLMQSDTVSMEVLPSVDEELAKFTKAAEEGRKKSEEEHITRVLKAQEEARVRDQRTKELQEEAQRQREAERARS
jgi:hypothetical protein